jgi:hypothetical protein
MNGTGESKRSLTTILVVYGLIFTGLGLILVSIIGAGRGWPLVLTSFLRDVGLLLAAVMGGTILHEKLLRDEAEERLIDKVDEMLESKVPKLQDIAEVTAETVHTRFCKEPPQMTGLRLLTVCRRNSPVYYRWTIEKEPQTLFFAGRSILHRIDADVRAKSGSSAEDVIFKRLMESSKITILFLDPRIDIVARLAEEEGERKDRMLGNIAVSLGVCRRLADRLQSEHRNLPVDAHLTIRIYNRLPYFAYHRQNHQVIIGFYFLTMEGSSSAAYEVIDEQTKKVFEDHFLKIRADSIPGTLVEFSGSQASYDFNVKLFDDLRNFLETQLDQARVSELLSGTSNVSAKATAAPAVSLPPSP